MTAVTLRFLQACAAACVLALAACVASEVATPAKSTAIASARRVPVLDGSLVAIVPAGFCFDRAASHDDDTGAVMVAGRCAAVSDPVVISVSIGGPESSGVLQSGARALSDWFTSRAGRAALARDGRAGSVKVIKTVVSDGALVLLVNDRLVGTYWRGVLGLKGHLVTVSVTAPAGAALDEAAGRKILDRTIAGLRAAN